jgi:hypothetical protein
MIADIAQFTIKQARVSVEMIELHPAGTVTRLP